jgi:hypothetical protein
VSPLSSPVALKVTVSAFPETVPDERADAVRAVRQCRLRHQVEGEEHRDRDRGVTPLDRFARPSGTSDHLFLRASSSTSHKPDRGVSPARRNGALGTSLRVSGRTEPVRKPGSRPRHLPHVVHVAHEPTT